MDDAQQSGSKPNVEVKGYEILREIGRGGFAVVYLARQPALNRTVALKLLTHIDPNDADSLRRFEAECQAIGSLSWHPHVVTVYDVGRAADGRPFMAMENLPSGSLQTKLHEHGSAPWTEAVRVGIQIADALAAAHEEGILHRDVKPANVLTDRMGEYRLADFGIARFGEISRTATGVITGTIAYTAPDVLAGAKHSVQADLYSLGAMLHCLITGKTPFVGDNDESLVTVMFRATTEPAPNLLPHGVPALFAALVEGLMAKDPTQRPGSAIEVGQWFQKIQQENGLVVTPLRSAPNARPAAPAGAASYAGIPSPSGPPSAPRAPTHAPGPPSGHRGPFTPPPVQVGPNTPPPSMMPAPHRSPSIQRPSPPTPNPAVSTPPAGAPATPSPAPTTPPPSGYPSTPPPGGYSSTPPPSGYQSTPPPSGYQSTPPPSSGYTSTPPSSGYTSTPPPTRPGSAPTFGPAYDATRDSGSGGGYGGRDTGDGVNKKVLAALAAGVAVLLLIGVAIAAGGGGDPPPPKPPSGAEDAEEFSAVVKEDWVQQCVAGGNGVAFCQCSYDSISEQIPFADYQRNVEEFGDDLDDYPLKFQTIFENCEQSTGG